MKKWMFGIGVVALLSVAVSSCLKDNSGSVPAPDCSAITTAAPDSEVMHLKTYFDSSAKSVLQDPRGFFYSMDSTVALDSGTHVLSCGTVAATYSGAILNAAKPFDSSNTPVALYLPNTITGWKEALPLMKKNATITLYLPPSLAYGAAGAMSQGVVVIPGNSYLVFTIKLYDFSNP